MNNKIHGVVMILFGYTHLCISNESVESKTLERHRITSSVKESGNCDIKIPVDISKNGIDVTPSGSINSEINDIVQKQYLMLPYPPFTKKDLENEEKYYQSSNRVSPYLFSYLIQLEYINHYLFEGKNDFL